MNDLNKDGYKGLIKIESEINPDFHICSNNINIPTISKSFFCFLILKGDGTTFKIKEIYNCFGNDNEKIRNAIQDLVVNKYLTVKAIKETKGEWAIRTTDSEMEFIRTIYECGKEKKIKKNYKEEDTELVALFEKAWEAYPAQVNYVGKTPAFKEFKAALKRNENITGDNIILRIKRYAETKQVKEGYVAKMTKWLKTDSFLAKSLDPTSAIPNKLVPDENGIIKDEGWDL